MQVMASPKEISLCSTWGASCPAWWVRQACLASGSCTLEPQDTEVHAQPFLPQVAGSFVGALADKVGRKKMCVVYAAFYAISCLVKLVNNYYVLMVITHAYIHTYINSYIHTYIHTYMPTFPHFLTFSHMFICPTSLAVSLPASPHLCSSQLSKHGW